MERTMLQKLFHGEIFPFENVVPTDPDYRVKGGEYGAYAEKVQHVLGVAEYERMESLRSDVHIMELEAMFAHGLQLGLFLMLELLPLYQTEKEGS